MEKKIEKVAVLGAGVMGSGIAAHLANAGIPCLMMDIVPPELDDADRKAGLTEKDPRFRNKFALKGLKGIEKSRPPHLYSKKFLPLVEVGNFDDDWERLKEVDWVIEAVVERLDIKKSILERLEKTVVPGTIVSSNTSGLSIDSMLQGRSDGFRKNFLVTHFFNPPRYMYLLEIVPGQDTDPEIKKAVERFGTYVLGKGIVHGKDTPNFVANRVGVFASMSTLHAMLEMDYRIDEVDAITGPAMGHPKSATFGTADLVGLDTFVHVVRTITENCPDDEALDKFKVPNLVTAMLEKGALGRKAGAGFFKMEKSPDGKKTLMVLDYKSGQYVPKEKPDIPSVKKAAKINDPQEKVWTLVYADDRGGKFAWRVLSETMAYAAHRLGEISDTVVDVDRGLKWGFNWELGPFETWDALGFKKALSKMQQDGIALPGWAGRMAEKGVESFYREGAGGREYYDPLKDKWSAEPKPEGFLLLKDLKREKKVIEENPGASLVDLGDGIACVEFHSALQPRMNPVDDQIIEMMRKGLAVAEKDFRGLVIHHQGEQFCAGANIAMLLQASQDKNWKAIEQLVRDFHAMTSGMRRARVPVVSAPFGFTFGGGAEIAMAGVRTCALAETYMGLVEVGVGLVPAGGGHVMMLERFLEGIDKPILSNLPFIQAAFETIAMAKVAGSAEEARGLHYLRPVDHIELQRGMQLQTAKRMAIAMGEIGYRPAMPRTFNLPGREGIATLKMVLHNMKATHWISDHDEKVATHVATILCGGDTTINSPVAEQTILDLEREAFLSLCGEEKTQERIAHMLKTGKPLRN